MGGLLGSAANLASPWAYVVLGLLAAAESAAFVGLAIPGETAMLLGGVLAVHGHVNLGVMMAAGAIGAVLGDSIGYEIGRMAGKPLRDSRLGRRVGQARWDKAEAYLRAKGGRAIFMGRFIGVLRALVPALAGMSGMPYRTFLPWNLAGGLIWAPGFVLLGYLAGGSYQKVERIAGRASLLLLLLLVLTATVVGTARWLARHPERVQAIVDRLLNRPPVARLRVRYRSQLNFLARRLRPGGALGLSLTATVLALAGAGWAFGAIFQDVLAGDELALVDRPTAAFLVAHREAWLTQVMRAVTDLGGASLLIPLLLVAGLGWRWRAGTWRPLSLLAAAYGGAWALQIGIKLLVRRPRPPTALAVDHFAGYAFPSGHATDAAALYGMLAALLAASTTRWGRKVAAWATASGLVALIGLSRLYLGGGWLTDVLGGFALGSMWLFALLTLTRTIAELHRNDPPDSATPTPNRSHLRDARDAQPGGRGRPQK
jgi:membrane protein DedA with SNARE-associated domain/membrane-associated phospholipid phosphatase